MYPTFLFIHSWLRWIVLALAVFIIVRSLTGWLTNRPYLKTDNAIAASFVGSMHLQLVIGLILYLFLSPVTQSAFLDFGAAMKNAALRYWAVEHIFVMIVAVVLAQIGRSRSKKVKEDKKKHRLSFLFYFIALILMLSRIPFDEAARLFR